MPRKSEQTEDSTTRDKVLQAAYSKAQTTLRERHLDEFNTLRAEYAAEQGVEWTPPLTAEQKAQQQIEALLAEHPALRDIYPVAEVE